MVYSVDTVTNDITRNERRRNLKNHNRQHLTGTGCVVGALR